MCWKKVCFPKYSACFVNKHQKLKGQSKKDNPELLATQGTQDEEKHNTICVGHHYVQTKTNKMGNTNPTKKPVVNSGAHEG